MATQFAPRRITFEDFVALPGGDERFELVDGAIVLMPQPIPRHQLLASEIEFALRSAAGTPACGLVLREVLVKLGTYRAVIPDVCFLRPSGRGRLARTHVEGPPDLVVEVLSAGHEDKDLHRNLEWYEEARVPEYWIASCDQPRFEVRCLGAARFDRPRVLAGADVLRTPLLPGLELPISSLYRDLPDA